jgi:hypothetical protein
MDAQPDSDAPLTHTADICRASRDATRQDTPNRNSGREAAMTFA